MHSIIRKEFHAKAGEETAKYNEQYTGRQTGADMTIREEAKTMEMKAKCRSEKLDYN
jgi:hypothetical protein